MLAGICTAIVIVGTLILWISLYETHHFVVSRHRFISEKIKKSTKAILLSDMHDYRYGKENELLLSAIEKENPDIVLLAGDMITAEKKDRMSVALAFIAKLKEKYPIYYAYGNHEEKICTYKERYNGRGEKFKEALNKMELIPLLNQHVDLPDRGISIYGLELPHAYYQRFHTKPMEDHFLEQLLGKKDEEKYSILLAHNPEYFPEYSDWGAEFVFSGHIHGGIVRIPFAGGVVSPAIRLFPKYDSGIFKEKESTMLLGRGIGTHSPTIRVFNTAELIVVEFLPKEEKGNQGGTNGTIS